MKMKYLVLIFLAIFVALLVSACATDSAGTSAKSTGGCTACDHGRAGDTVWCDGCGVGYVKGVKIKCKGCFTAKTGGPKCTSCK